MKTKTSSRQDRSKHRKGGTLRRDAGETTGRAKAGPGSPKAGARDEVLHIQRWQGEIDPQAVNGALLAVMRAVDAKSALTEAERARRCHMTRQKYHQLSTDVKVATVPALVQWANGHHLNAAFLFGQVVDWVCHHPPRE